MHFIEVSFENCYFNYIHELEFRSSNLFLSIFPTNNYYKLYTTIGIVL